MKKFKKIIRAVLVLAVLAGLIYLIPKVITVVRLKRAADSYVAASSVSTFKDSKTTIIYDTNDQELCTMKNTKDVLCVVSGDSGDTGQFLCRHGRPPVL